MQSLRFRLILVSFFLLIWGFSACQCGKPGKDDEGVGERMTGSEVSPERTLEPRSEPVKESAREPVKESAREPVKEPTPEAGPERMPEPDIPPHKQCVPYERGLVLATQEKPTQIRDVAWSPSGDRLAAISHDGQIRVWDAKTAVIQESIKLTASVPAWKVAFAPDGKGLLSLNEDAVTRWVGGKELRKFVPPTAGDKARTMAVGTIDLNGKSVALVAIGYQTSGGKGVVSWHSLDARAGFSRQLQLASKVVGIALTADAKTTAIGLADGSIVLAATETGKKRSEVVAAHQGAVQGLAWAKAGTLLASGGADTKVKLWQVADPTQAPKLLQTLEGHQLPVTTVAFSADQTLLASGSSAATDPEIGAVKLWDVSSLSSTHAAVEIPQPSFHRKDGTLGLSWHPDPKQKRYLVGYARGPLLVWVYNGRIDALYQRKADAPLTSIALFRERGMWLLGDAKGTIYYPESAQKVYKKSLGSPIVQVAWGPISGKGFAVVKDGSIHAWDYKTDKVSTYKASGKTATCLSIRRDGRGFLVGFDDGSIEFLRDGQMTKPLASWSGLHKASITSVNWGFNGDVFVTSAANGEIKVWSYSSLQKTPKLLSSFQAPAGHVPVTAAFSFDDSRVAVGLSGGKIAIWRRHASPPIWEVFSSKYGSSIIAWQRNGGDFLLSARMDPKSQVPEDSLFHVWDAATPGKLRYVTSVKGKSASHSGPITGFALHVWNQYVGTSSLDGTYIAWKLGRAYPVFSASFSAAPIGLAVRPDGKTLVVGTAESSLYIWDLSDPMKPSKKIVKAHAQSVPHLLISRAGDLLYTGGLDGKMLKWDLKTSTPTVLETYPKKGSAFQPAVNITGMALGPKEDSIVIGASTQDGEEKKPGQLVFWKVNDASKPEQVFNQLSRVLAVAWHPLQDLVISTHQSGDAKVWKRVGGIWKNTQTFPKLHPYGTTKVAIGGVGGELVATAGSYGDILVWKLADGVLVHRFDSGGAVVSKLLFHPVRNLLAASLSNGQVKIWDLATGKLLRLLVDPDLKKAGVTTLAHEGVVYTMVWSVDGNTLFTSGSDFKTKQWKCVLQNP